jgi:hypothetical protein
MESVVTKSLPETSKYSIKFGRGSYSRRREVFAWCATHFGDEMVVDPKWGIVWSERWRQTELWGYSTVYFRDGRDFTFFLLSWGDLDYDC